MYLSFKVGKLVEYCSLPVAHVVAAAFVFVHAVYSPSFLSLVDGSSVSVADY